LINQATASAFRRLARGSQPRFSVRIWGGPHSFNLDRLCLVNPHCRQTAFFDARKRGRDGRACGPGDQPSKNTGRAFHQLANLEATTPADGLVLDEATRSVTAVEICRSRTQPPPPWRRLLTLYPFVFNAYGERELKASKMARELQLGDRVRLTGLGIARSPRTTTRSGVVVVLPRPKYRSVQSIFCSMAIKDRLRCTVLMSS